MVLLIVTVFYTLITVRLLQAAAWTPRELPCTTLSDPVYPHGLLLNCSGRGLVDVPPSLYPETTTVLLSYNNISRVRNFTFTQLTELRDLDLSFNVIGVLEVRALAGLGKLFKLSLRGNHLWFSPCNYPAEVFKPLVALQVLDISRQHCLRQNSSRNLYYRGVDEREKELNYVPNSKKVPRKTEVLNGFRTLQNLSAQDVEAVFSQTDLTTFQADGGHVRAGEYSYPDLALSALTSLKCLTLDGLTNNSLGPGFRQLVNLTHVDMNGQKGFCLLFTVNATTFANLVSVTHLNLSFCYMIDVTPDAFSSVPTLQHLNLSYNQALGFDLLGEIFLGLNDTKLDTLVVNAIVPSRSLGTTLRASQLRYFKDLRYLVSVEARFNRLESVEDVALCNSMPPNLQYLNLGGNLLELASYVNNLHCLRSLQYLYLDGISGYWTPVLRPPALAENTAGVIHQQTFESQPLSNGEVQTEEDLQFEVSEDEIPAHCTFRVPPKLTKLSARNGCLAYKLLNINIDYNNSLTMIDLSRNYLPVWQGPMCGFHSLKELYLMKANAEFLNNEFFPSFPALEVLNISSNWLRPIFYTDYNGRLLRGLSKLRVLDLSQNDLGHLHGETLKPLVSLEKLHIANNGIGTFNVSLDHMPNISFIDFSKNQLATLSQEIRNHLDTVSLNRNVTIRMTFNPISCICKNMDFLVWMVESRIIFSPFDNYFCQMAGGSVIRQEDFRQTVAELQRTCVDLVGVLVGAAASCVLVLTLLLVALAYRYRWKLRYLYYASRLGLMRRRRETQSDSFDFDAFVSFAGEDDDFVQGELQKELEERRGLRLCIHSRDFVPGRYITSNIVDCVQRSRRTLVVLTCRLLASEWCRYELQMALMEAAHTGRDVLLFLLYQHVPTEQLSVEVLASLQAASYIEFPHEVVDKEIFWNRLAAALTA